MAEEVKNDLHNVRIGRDYIGGNQTNNQYIFMFQDKEREFVVTYKVNIKPVSYFVGREQELKDLWQRVEQRRKSILVSGMGGIGKTHICRKLFEEYFLKHENKETIPFDHIGYIEYNGDMGSSLVECLKYKKQERAEQNLEAAWRELEYLASDGKLLLFVDNVNVAISQDPSLKRLTSLPGTILLTSRRTSFSKEFEPYRIGFLTTEECKEIYENIRFEKREQKVKEEEGSDLEYIIEHLAARHTLTVELLAYLAQTKEWTVKRLKEELERNGFQLEYENEEEELVNIQKSYEILYNLSELTEEEKNILEAFSVFPYLPLSSEVCKEWLLPDIGGKEQEDIFKRLYRKGWLQEEQESYLLHPVFSQFIYEKCKPRLEKHRGLIKACKKSLEVSEKGVVLECQKYIPFGESIIEKVEMEKELEQKNFLDTLGYVLYYIGEYKKAEKWYKEVLRISEELLGENHPDTATSYHNLAEVYSNQGEYEKAKVLYEKSLRIYEELLGENHPDTTTSYNNLAGVYFRQGEYEKAKELFEKSLRICEEVLGENHSNTATVYHNLAGVYSNQGEYEKAKVLFKKSLRIREEVLGENHLDTATSYNNLALVYSRQGEYEKAKVLYEKSLRIYEEVLGENHPDTATGYHNLAEVYSNQGEYEKAKVLFKKSLRIREEMLGETHPDTATSYNNLAGVYFRQGEYEKAKKLFEKSLGINKEMLGENHPDTATSYNNLAGVYFRKGEYKKAKELFEKSLRIRKEMLGESHLDTADSYHNLAGVYFSQRKYKIALDYFFKAYKILSEKFGFNHPTTQIFYRNMKATYKNWNPKGNFERWLKKMREKID